MAHDKEKNGLIVRIALDNGYKAYRPEWKCRAQSSWGARTQSTERNRQIQLMEGYYSLYDWVPRSQRKLRPVYNGPTGKEEDHVSKRAENVRRPETSRGIGRVLVQDDPVEDGQSLARSPVPLPSDRAPGVSRDISITTADDKEVADLVRQGILTSDTLSPADRFDLNSIEHTEPLYPIRMVPARRKGRGGRSRSNPDLTASALDFVNIAGSSCGANNSGLHDDMCFDFEFVEADDADLESIAGSWVEMDWEDAVALLQGRRPDSERAS
jgi:hypothetical protein